MPIYSSFEQTLLQTRKYEKQIAVYVYANNRDTFVWKNLAFLSIISCKTYQKTAGE